MPAPTSITLGSKPRPCIWPCAKGFSQPGHTAAGAISLRRIAATTPRIRLIEHASNQGKGAAIRTAIHAATGELSVIQDADLEYYPDDWGLMLRPFFESNADAVYGSRLLSSEYRRVLYFWHSLGNYFLTLFSNMMTDLSLTDMETCYK